MSLLLPILRRLLWLLAPCSLLPALWAAEPAQVPTELRSARLEMTSTDDETTTVATPA